MTRPFLRTLQVLLVFTGVGTSATPLAAWGPDGHRAVAQLATERLSPQASRQVARLLGRDTMVDVAVWADEVRDTTHPESVPWHFTNIPIASAGFSRTRDCRQGNCVVAAIERMEATLKDAARPLSARQQALKFLIHLIGDIHQPLHAGDNGDRGGNQRTVAAIGNARNLHAAWDGGIIQAMGRTQASLIRAANDWLHTQVESRLAAGSPSEWANESFRLSRDIVYAQVKDDGAITGGERTEALRLIEKRIARAGVRLAATLNRIYAAAPR